MTTPTRLRLKAAPGSTLRQGLELARSRGPTDEQLRDLERNVLASLGVAAAVSVVTAAAAKAAPSASIATSVGLSAGATKLAVGVALAALASGSAVGVWHWSRPSGARHTAAAVVAAPRWTPQGAQARAPASGAAALAPTVSVAVAVPAAEPPAAVAAPLGRLAPAATPRSARVAAPATAVRTGAPPSTRTIDQDRRRAADDGEELRLLARAQRALSGDPALALALAGEHERRFPVSAMDQERDVIAVTALQRLGRSAEARRRAERFAHEHPGSAYSARIRSMVPLASPTLAPEER